jgi:hypothetical protein
MRYCYLFCFVTFVVMGQSPAAVTSTPPTRDSTFAPVGLAFSETARINVANTAANPSGTNSTPASCTGTISFNTSTGASAQTPAKFTVTSGQIFSSDLTAAKLGVINGSRAEFIGSVQLTLTPKTPCSLAISLETFDAVTGVTHVYLTNPGNGPASVSFYLP